LKKISVQGGAALPLCNASFGVGGSWGEDGSIIAALAGRAGLSRIPSAGGPPVRITDLGATYRWPEVLPGGKAVLYTAVTDLNDFGGVSVEVMSLHDRRRKILQPGGIFGRYLLSGHLVYLHSGTLFAVPFDLDRLEMQSTPVPLLEKVAYDRYGTAQLD